MPGHLTPSNLMVDSAMRPHLDREDGHPRSPAYIPGRSDRGSVHVGEWVISAESGNGIPPTVHHSKRDPTILRVTTSSQGEPRQFAEGDVPDPAFLLFRAQSRRGDVEGDVRLDDGS
jgi:hypothetical protein